MSTKRQVGPQVQQILDNIRDVLAAREIPLRELSRLCGWKEGYTSHLLNHHMDLKLHHLFDIANALELDAAELFQPARTPSELPEEVVEALDNLQTALSRVRESVERWAS